MKGYLKAMLALATLVFLFMGCVQTQATMLSSKTYPPITTAEVVIYLAEEDIPGTFEKIAIISAQGEATYTNENQMYNAARKRAAKIGANGVLLQDINEPGSGAKVAGALFGTGTTRRGQMIAIRVL